MRGGQRSGCIMSQMSFVFCSSESNYGCNFYIIIIHQETGSHGKLLNVE